METESFFSGLIPLDAFREILRHPLLAHVPFILETPAFFSKNRDNGYGLGAFIGEKERRRTGLELDFLVQLAGISDEEWSKEKKSHTVWKEYRRQKKNIEATIRKKHVRATETTKAVFREDRRKKVSATRSATKIKTCRTERDQMAAGEAATPRNNHRKQPSILIEVEPEQNVRNSARVRRRRLRSASRKLIGRITLKSMQRRAAQVIDMTSSD